MRLLPTLLIICLPLGGLQAQNTDTAAVAPQKTKIKVNVFDGVVMAGYVDQGIFLNFTGPNISFSTKDSKIILGMLPSLRFRQDNSTPKNSVVMPTLGAGVTYCYKFLAVQVPVYYNPKTSTANGRWHVGVGVGLRINAFHKKTKK